MELTRLIKGARLIILPGAHGEFLGERAMTPAPSRLPEITAALVEHFLDDSPATGSGPVLPK